VPIEKRWKMLNFLIALVRMKELTSICGLFSLIASALEGEFSVFFSIGFDQYFEVSLFSMAGGLSYIAEKDLKKLL
jgi:hypothetical protein